MDFVHGNYTVVFMWWLFSSFLCSSTFINWKSTIKNAAFLLHLLIELFIKSRWTQGWLFLIYEIEFNIIIIYVHIGAGLTYMHVYV